MRDYSSIRATAQAAIAEALANARVQQPFSSFITRNASYLYNYASGDGKEHFKLELEKLLKIVVPDPTVVFRGIVIQLNGVFEGFVKSLVSAHVTGLASQVNTFSELSDPLKNAYAVKAGAVMTRLHDGSLNGVKYDFPALLESVGSCFADATPFSFKGDVFTALMGNCTPERLERLFEQVGLPEPFSDTVGRHKSIQALYIDGKGRRAANKLKEELSFHIENRNDLVHGLATKAIVISDVQDCANFYTAIIDAYTDLASAAV